ncbi:MAG: DUF4143 domain-containing protein [Candidatus Krumholzibacteria bacterium]|jgi:hypothetical protein|nr:DUF4143 domain-containing protein [Candidatus Krumholzibacteria bacterium]MDP6670033.1 DUF4143 domain-containing protein [Candidatus Krumholzibacteria bacterium]MDP6796453.1 DUF4143 domain-containing protein [Candidatus Krumholzibacteria bacterium]MDP7022467.1 DUF4143 domain-containing protein [Candidatus Krumholzibacteria bacterium]
MDPSEQFIAQHLHILEPANMSSQMTYWLREGRSNNAEVDFLVQVGGDIVPVEVKAGKSGTLKSLHEFVRARDPERAIRFDMNLPSRQAIELAPGNGSSSESVSFELLSLPLYLVEQLGRLLQ